MVCCTLIPTPGYLRFYFGLAKTAGALTIFNKQMDLYSYLSRLQPLCLLVSHWCDQVKVKWFIFTLGMTPFHITWDYRLFQLCIFN